MEVVTANTSWGFPSDTSTAMDEFFCNASANGGDCNNCNMQWYFC